MSLYKRNRAILIDSIVDKHGYLLCQKCGKSHCGFKFECHHIVFKSEAQYHQELNNILNLIICGTDCHTVKPDSFHKQKSVRNKLVLERGLNELFRRNLIIED